MTQRNAHIDTPEQIDAFRARVLLRGLRLETLGMTKRGQSCYAIHTAWLCIKNVF